MSESLVGARAYAKLNLSLEVLGRRPDGYHEVVSLAHSISIHDVLRLRLPSPSEPRFLVRMEPPLVEPSGDLALLAAERFAQATGSRYGAHIAIRKRIPIAAGLGGGSTDAAAVLRGLNRLWGTRLALSELMAIAAGIGSDVPFCLRVGAALVRGRGEQVTPLPAAHPFWVALACPPHSIAEKSRTLYAALGPEDWTDGTATLELARRIAAGQSPVDQVLVNSFDRVANLLYEGFAGLRERLAEAAGVTLHLTGAGPGLFAMFSGRTAALAAATRMASLGVPTYVARTISLERSPRGTFRDLSRKR